MSSPILEYMGYGRMAEYCDEILLGTEIGQDTGNKFTRAFLRQLKYANGTLPDKE